MSNLLQKISWNQSYYQNPDISGYYVERDKDNYVSNTGTGLESWNFNTHELIDGKVYGYLRADSKNLFKEKHDIYFFSKNLNNEYLLVGLYKDCRFLTEIERIKLKKKMIQSGLLDKRINQIYRTLKEEEDFSEWTWEDVENLFEDEMISFKLEVEPKNVILFEPKIPFDIDKWKKISNKGIYDKFSNFTYIEDIDLFKKTVNL